MLFAVNIKHISGSDCYFEGSKDACMTMAHAAIVFPNYVNSVKVWDCDTLNDCYVWENPDCK